MNVKGMNMDVHAVNMGSSKPVRARELTSQLHFASGRGEVSK